jgi:hypothetical protein
MCRTFSELMRHQFGNMHLTLTYEMCGSRNYLVYFGQPENDEHCVLYGVWFCVSFVHDFGSVTLLFSGTPISGM